ncbi:SRPBCC family protein [Yinghuangia seranimata]|uniref:SRPBCC family protein n=1 Tax=Yinghuangia seranimata TaxID=408067 RepID=UPI00248B2E54|nr:SRPBCC domain-containing protein [Yinghuangia seranimata]MDI2132942.1 SRPBCC domain-containing protein [Yinghuangia seranimata]
MPHEVGNTQGACFEIGVSKALPYPADELWRFLTSPEGLALWLGAGAELEPVRGAAYRTDEGAEGEVRGYEEFDRVRVTFRPAGWDHETTLQVRLSGGTADRTTLRFHQERLADADERARQRAHWQAVMAAVEKALEEPAAADEG